MLVLVSDNMRDAIVQGILGGILFTFFGWLIPKLFRKRKKDSGKDLQ